MTYPISTSCWLRNASCPASLLPPELAGDDPGALVSCDLEVSESGLLQVLPSTDEVTRGEDLEGQILLPGFCDAHVHLDKAHTWNRSPNPGHTFAEALQTLHADKAHWNEAEMTVRAEFTLRSAWAHGVSAIRTHVDTWGDESRSSFKTLSQLRDAWSDRIELQLVSLCGVEQYATAEGKAFADIPAEFGAAALGGMPLMGPDLDKQLDALFTLAAERALPIDLHVDESGNAEAACLRAVARAALRHNFPLPVTCGHCCSLAVQPEAEARETLELVREAGLQIITLPLCNAYLQDRRLAGEWRQTPHWRGLTLVQEMLAAGIPVAAASDNVRDAFYAYGDLDTWEVIVQTLRLAHLDNAYGTALSLGTRAAAEIMGLPHHGRLEPGSKAEFVVFPAKNWSQLFSRPWRERKLWRGTAWRDAELPDFAELKF